MQQLVDDLLLLARVDSGGAPGHRRPVDLDGLVERPRPAAAPRERWSTRRGVRPVQVPGGAAELDRGIGNVLDNAVRHARSRVVVAVTEQPDGTAVLTVTDDGPGIPDADATGSSSGSSGSTPPARPATASASGWGWRSRGTWRRGTAGR